MRERRTRSSSSAVDRAVVAAALAITTAVATPVIAGQVHADAVTTSDHDAHDDHHEYATASA